MWTCGESHVSCLLVSLIQAELIKPIFLSQGFFFFLPPLNVAIHSGVIKQNAGATFINEFLQLRLTQWGFELGHSGSVLLKTIRLFGNSGHKLTGL